jgi:hypothetical protein
MPLSQVETLSRLCELPLAFANNLEDFLYEHGHSHSATRTSTLRAEPKPSHLLLLLNLPHLVTGISFFSFSTRVFQCWKPLLRLLCLGRLIGSHTIRSFLTRSWTLSLIDRQVPHSFHTEMIPRHWANEFNRCNFFLFSFRNIEISSTEIMNSHHIHLDAVIAASTHPTYSSSPYTSFSFGSRSDRQPPLENGMMIGKQFQMFRDLCVEKLKVFREYILMSDQLWTDPAVIISSKSTVMTARSDLILDFMHVYTSTMAMTTNIQTSSERDVIIDTIENFLPNTILVLVLSSLRIVIFFFGYAMEEIIGTSSDTETDCLISCLTQFLIGCSVMDLITSLIPMITQSDLFVSWKLIQQSPLCLMFQQSVGDREREISSLLCLEVRHLISQDSGNTSSSSSSFVMKNLSVSLKEECLRMVSLIEEKLHSPSVRLTRSFSLITVPELIERCRQRLLQD